MAESLPPNSIFICYRRADSEEMVDRIYDTLSEELGEETIFRDIDSIPPGVDFPIYIEERVRDCPVILVFIGKDWATCADAHGQRRIDDPGDHVRVEVETALALPGARVIPIFVKRAKLPLIEELPESLQPLRRRSGLTVRSAGPDYKQDVVHLSRILIEAVHSVRAARQAAVEKQRRREKEMREQEARNRPDQPWGGESRGIAVVLTGVGLLLAAIFCLFFRSWFWAPGRNGIGSPMGAGDDSQSPAVRPGPPGVAVPSPVETAKSLTLAPRVKAAPSTPMSSPASPVATAKFLTPVPRVNPTPTTPMTSPALATKDHPFVNSLGMRFVPVPGTNVLFSVWDTRVQDYAEFAQAKGITPEKPKFEQGPTHPVVLVSWDSAKAFCEWLSQKEGRRYRLPTDAEWSIAVGLGEEIGKNPREKSVNAKGYDYPWGAQWPPPKGAGNFADETAKKVQSGWSYIEGYDDGYAYTSPVGSFAPNRFGLYDMGGNVWQWCEDWLDESKVAHTVRGGAWALYGPLSIVLRSSHRSFSANSSETTGFRCVLDLSVR